MSDLEQAIILACKAHEGQFDKAGEPYILHPLRVMLAMPPDDPLDRIAAVLHDVVEDSDCEGDLLRFGEEVQKSVLALTRLEGEKYAQYIWRVKLDERAKRVKVQDLLDNLRPERMRRLAMADRTRLQEKYTKALGFMADSN